MGNIFLGDDGVGPEVVRRLAGEPLREGVTVRDYGVGGVHLAYDLLEGFDVLVLVDALPRGSEPGTVRVIEVRPDDVARVTDRPSVRHADPAPSATPNTVLNAHAMDPLTVLANLAVLGGVLPRTLVVGVEPCSLEEGLDLSPEVGQAVPTAVKAVRDVLRGVDTTAGTTSIC